jgi:hypothetical protein
MEKVGMRTLYQNFRDIGPISASYGLVVREHLLCKKPGRSRYSGVT